ncbi:MAG: hypothetical protein JNL84_05465 [Candidatus Accumulibacter sp.]|nr:hypothetical protein [Accumulibacter sp.]
MKSRFVGLTAVLAALGLSACVSVPTGPSVMVLPGSGRSFDQFRYDDAECRQFAHLQIGGTTSGQNASTAGINSAVVGTAVGAVAGAAIGGRQGAAVGAGTGLLFGSASGSGAAQSSAHGTQRQYDNAYVQCMYAKGHSVPVSGNITRQQMSPVTPASSGTYPPPPRGTPPPPPPGYR